MEAFEESAIENGIKEIATKKKENLKTSSIKDGPSKTNSDQNIKQKSENMIKKDGNKS